MTKEADRTKVKVAAFVTPDEESSYEDFMEWLKQLDCCTVGELAQEMRKNEALLYEQLRTMAKVLCGPQYACTLGCCAQDIASNAFMVIRGRLEQLCSVDRRINGSPQSYSKRMLHNAIIDQLRRLQRDGNREREAISDLQPPTIEKDMHQISAEHEEDQVRRQCCYQSFVALSERDQMIVAMRYILNKGHSEIADAVHVSQPRVSQILATYRENTLKMRVQTNGQ